LDQLAEGGKMIIPLGERYNQAFYLVEKHAGKIEKTKLLPTLFVPMTGMAESQRKTKVDGAHPKIVNGSFEDAKEGKPDGWYYARQAEIEHKGAPHGKNYLAFTNKESGREAHALQGVGIDGKKIKGIKISLKVRAEQAMPGVESYEKPGLAVRFFDDQN